jgi:high frequency lysogenization protein
MLGSLLVRDPKDTLEVFGGDDLNLRDGYRALAAPWSATPAACSANRCATPCRCWAWSANWPSVATCSTPSATACRSSPRPSISAWFTKTSSLPAEPVSGHPEHLAPAHPGARRHALPAATSNASKIRALLLAGIRAARLWRQLGGHRWQLVFSRRKLLNELYDMMRTN